MCKAPFSLTNRLGITELDLTKITEKVIAGGMTALIIGLGSWFMFVADMKKQQEIIQIGIGKHIEIADRRYIEFVAQNNKDHQTILDDNKVMYSHVMDQMQNITHELRAIRNDFYRPLNGNK